jgi:hypothetical protein
MSSTTTHLLCERMVAMGKTAAVLAVAALSVAAFFLFGTTRNAANFERQSQNNALKFISIIGNNKSPMNQEGSSERKRDSIEGGIC